MVTSPSSQPDSGGPSPPDLWKRAFSRLQPEVQEQLQQVHGGKHDVVAALLATVEDKRRWCIRRQCRLKTPGGRVVIVRDVLEKMARWIDRFKGAVDAAVQYDPAHAALPWAAVRFVLQAALDDIKAHSSILEALESFTRIMTRCARIQALHVQKTQAAAAVGSVEEALTRLYTQLLSSLGVALCYFDKSHAARLFANIIEPSTLQSLESQEQQVLKLVSLSHSETLRDLETSVHRLMDTSTLVRKSIDREQSIHFLTWLSSTRVSDHHRSVSSARISGSCSWILRHDVYRTWLENSSSSLLVLQGIRGCGKTFLVSAVVDALGEPTFASTDPTVPCVFFYCSNSMNERDRASPSAILRSIVRQLAVSTTDASTCTIDDKVWAAYNQKLERSQADRIDLEALECEECCSLLLEMTLTNPMYLVIDAIDELTETSRAMLLRFLQRLLSESRSLVKILVSARDNTHIEALLPAGTFTMQVSREVTAQDMQVFIRQQIDEVIASARLLDGKVGSGTSDEIIRVLSDGSGEMFQWVVLQVNFLCTRTSEQDVRLALESGLIATLDELYADAFTAILNQGPFSKDVALQIFSWLLYGKSLLTVDAIGTATVTQFDRGRVDQMTELDMMRICQNLIQYDTELRILRFCHPSVADFLRQQPELATARAHGILATACLRQCIDGEPQATLLTKADPIADFSTYAALHWWEHARASESINGVEDATTCTMLEFVFGGNQPCVSLPFHFWLDWIRHYTENLPVYDSQKRIFEALQSAQGQAMFTACMFGLTILMQYYLDTVEDKDVNILNELGHTSIYLAAFGGHTEIVRMLHQHGADTSITCGALGNPLQAACFHGRLQTAGILLEVGVSVRSVGKFSNALEAACRGARTAVARMLLERGCIETAEDYHDAMRWSTENGLEEVVDWLMRPLTQKSFTSATTDQTANLVLAAIKRGSISSLEKLLRLTSDTNSLLPEDALAIASYYGHVHMAKYLRHRGLSLETEGPYGSPLRSACLAGHEAMARLLISWDADVDRKDEKGHALQAAAMKGHARLVMLLLSEKAKLHHGCGRDGCGGDGDEDEGENGDEDPLGTPLEAASYYGHTAVVELLLEAGANPNLGGYFWDAMHAALEGGRSDVALLLLRSGYDAERCLGLRGPMCLREPPSESEEAKMASDRAERRRVSGYDVDAYRGTTQGLVSLCARRGNVEILSTLIRQFSPTDMPSRGRFTLELQLSIPSAAAHGHLAVVKRLLAAVGAESASGRVVDMALVIGRALARAASNSQVETIDFLSGRLHCLGLHKEGCECELPVHGAVNADAPRISSAFKRALSVSPNREISGVFWSHISSWGYQFFDWDELVQDAIRHGGDDVLELFLVRITKTQTAERAARILKDAIITAAHHHRPMVSQLILDHAMRNHPSEAHGIASAGYLCSCQSGSDEVANVILQDGANISLNDQDLLSGWILAAVGKHERTMTAIASSITWEGDDEIERGLVRDAFVAAAANGLIEAAQMVLSHIEQLQGRVAVSATLERAFIASCFLLSEAGIDFCLGLGADVNANVVVPEDVCQRYAALVDYNDTISEPWHHVTDRCRSVERPSSGHLTATQAALGGLYRLTPHLGDKLPTVVNVFLHAFDEATALSTTHPWDARAARESPAPGAVNSVMQLLISRGASLDPSPPLRRPARDVEVALLASLPDWAHRRDDSPQALGAWDGLPNVTAERAAAALFDSGARDLMTRLFDAMPALRVTGRRAYAMWLYVAAAAGDERLVEVLIANGADVDHRAIAGMARVKDGKLGGGR